MHAWFAVASGGSSGDGVPPDTTADSRHIPETPGHHAAARLEPQPWGEMLYVAINSRRSFTNAAILQMT